MPARSVPSTREPQDQSALLQQAQALLVQGNLAAAEAIYRQLLGAGVEDASLLSNLAVICWQRDQHDEMERLLRHALRLQPRNASAHYNLALVLAQRGAGSEAIHHYRQALPLASSELQASIRWNLSKLLLRQGDYPEGWQHYEWRRHKAKPLPPICQPGMPAWDGRSVISDALVLVGEQGLGDMLQFLRYMPALQQTQRDLWLCLPPPLIELARVSGLAPRVLTPEEWEATPMPQRPSQWVPLLSLAWHLGVTPQQPLVDAPYLQSTPHSRRSWRQRIRAASCRAVVALHWQGNREHGHLLGRSLPLEQLAPLADLEGIELLSLQKCYGSEQLQACSFRQRFLSCQPEVEDCWSFVDTAAMVQACDLVITTDSALAHLAGALGAPTWLLLHHPPDWRWGEQGDSTFWYPSMRLFRQQQRGDWPAVIDRVKLELQSWLACRRSQ